MKSLIRFLFNLIRGIVTLGWHQIYCSFHKRVKDHFVKTSDFLKNAALQEKFQSISNDVQNFQAQANYTLNKGFKHIRISEKLVIFPVFFWLAISILLPLLNVHTEDVNTILSYSSPLLILSILAFIYSILVFPYSMNIKIFNLMRAHERIEKNYWDLHSSSNRFDSYKFLESFQTGKLHIFPLGIIWVLLTFIPSVFITAIFLGGEYLFVTWGVTSIIGIMMMLYLSWFFMIHRRYNYHLENHHNLGFIAEEIERKEIISVFTRIKNFFTVKRLIRIGAVLLVIVVAFGIKDFFVRVKRKSDKLLYVGKHNYSKGYYIQAIGCLDKGLNFYKFRFDKPTWEPYYCRAMCYYNLEQYDRGSQDFDEALKLVRELPKRRLIPRRPPLRAPIQKVISKEEEIKEIGKLPWPIFVSKFKPNYYSIKEGIPDWLFFMRGKLLMKQEKYKMAIEDFTKLVGSKVPGSTLSGYYNRGLAYCLLGEYEKALKDFDRVIEYEPGAIECYEARGMSYYYLGNYSLAVIDFEKAIEIWENMPEAWKQEAWKRKLKIDTARKHLPLAKLKMRLKKR